MGMRFLYMHTHAFWMNEPTCFHTSVRTLPTTLVHERIPFPDQGSSELFRVGLNECLWPAYRSMNRNGLINNLRMIQIAPMQTERSLTFNYLEHGRETKQPNICSETAEGAGFIRLSRKNLGWEYQAHTGVQLQHRASLKEKQRTAPWEIPTRSHAAPRQSFFRTTAREMLGRHIIVLTRACQMQ
jgi:hypothetical protein